MVTYLTNAMCWLHGQVERLYMSCQVKGIFLTPTHSWMHDCIHDWTRKSGPDLTTSTV